MISIPPPLPQDASRDAQVTRWGRIGGDPHIIAIDAT